MICLSPHSGARLDWMTAMTVSLVKTATTTLLRRYRTLDAVADLLLSFYSGILPSPKHYPELLRVDPTPLAVRLGYMEDLWARVIAWPEFIGGHQLPRPERLERGLVQSLWVELPRDYFDYPLAPKPTTLQAEVYGARGWYCGEVAVIY